MAKAKKQSKQGSLAHSKQKFLKLYPEYGAVGPTMKAIGLKCRRTFYNWLENDPKFKELYLTELMPNRRDELVSLVYRVASGKLGTYTKTTERANGDIITEEVPYGIPQTQLTAAFGFLKATDHNDTGEDRMIFVEKHQLEVSGKDGKPIILKVVYDDSNKGIHDTPAES